jgi:hypothetical protein
MAKANRETIDAMAEGCDKDPDKCIFIYYHKGEVPFCQKRWLEEVRYFPSCFGFLKQRAKEKPHEIRLIKAGYVYGFIGKHEKCEKCGAEMLGQIKSYPPYCDSTYEQWHCPVCDFGYSMSA